jgi:diaminopimelate epimerase
MRLPFTKMHGLGNDFVVINNVDGGFEIGASEARRIAERRRGVGCDQVLVAEASDGPNADFRMRIFNADGSEAGQCGNGVRCFASFLRAYGLTNAEQITIATVAGVVNAVLKAPECVTVDMGPPCMEPARIPFVANGPAPRYRLDLGGQAVSMGVVSMGNPHAVLQVPAVRDAPVSSLGPKLQAHARFPEGVNVGFMEIVDRSNIRLRVFERGVGETQACGTGACAAVVVGRLQALLDENVNVELPGGTLALSWKGNGQSVQMTGPSTRVFEGHIEL